jgi:serine/threonine-protein kinase
LTTERRQVAGQSARARGTLAVVETNPFASTMADHALVGSLLGERYSVEALLHEGRRNDLFIVRDLVDSSTRSLVAKIPHELSTEAVEVLAREAGFLSVIHHPNVVGLHDIGSDDHHAYLLMDAIVGDTLAETLERNGPMAGQEVFEIFWQILAAARAMADVGVVHRDLRPRNISLEHREGRAPLVRVIDFASAKFLSDDHPDSQHEPAYPVGAHRYMAPEQHQGEASGPWVDVYAIGAMLYAALVGELPEAGVQLLEERDVGRPLADVVARAVAEEPGERFLTALEFQDALTRAVLIA